jgi:diguanylate cyclase (GGDEF)-like protein
MLRLIRISTVQNLFVISRDRDKNYYFLLDSDKNPKTRATLFEPFNPLGDFWNKCYKFKKPEIFHHKNSKDLWISIAYPIVENGKTVAIIGADISHKLDSNIQTKLQNFGNFFLWILFLGAVWFIILYFLTLYFRRKFYEGYIDPLTEIYNRKYLYEIVIKKLSRNYQLLMVDIDLFKKINDTYGHDAGDYILKEVAHRMSLLIREEDSLIRYGGEEFLIYTTKLTPKQSIDFAERLRESVKKEPIKYNGHECYITVSIGVNAYATDSVPFNNMLKEADEALYKAKVSGRDCVIAVE